ncbi:putative aldehyde dehydrogenase family protein [Exophiala viscosa]|uniref:aldehyde dehydrogenase (NAD(+)) n=1 Tax=Exophiala viscosa TaxID=2486360 RepID=A0AAN6IHL5_9EURO|nr:putative aldehyde dehydrogenase family protein [Exophiala viscosa]
MSDIPHISNWVDGVHEASSSEKISVVNPANGQIIATIDATTQDNVNDIVRKSVSTFKDGPWARADASERYAVLSKAATLLRARIPEFIELETRQTGRPIREMRAQLARVPEWLPLGVVAQITPWNHPLLIAMKKIAAALAAGNVVIVKPSELAPLSVLKMGELLKEAGLPDGVLQIISGYGRETGKFLCESPLLAKIDLTGGILTYRAIAPIAALNMVPMTAELGGKAPVCLFPSLDVEQAVKAALFASFIASGQTCVTGSRLLVHKDIYTDFMQLMERRVKELRLGDPQDSRTQIGAVINKASVERCSAFVERASNDGGKVICGGKPATVEGKGFFFEPTIIETNAGADVACNEVFGPIIAVIKCESEDEIIRIANDDTAYALGASVWTNDFNQAHRVAAKIEAGIVWVNGHHLNDPSSPWGGFKESGVGKENGQEAFESYTKLKSTVINYGIQPTWFDPETLNARYG